MNGLGATATITGIGTVGWSFRDDYGVLKRVLVEAYLIPSSKVRLFSPQQYFKQEGAGEFSMNVNGSTFKFHDGSTLSFKYDNSSLPKAMGIISSLPTSSGYLATT